MKAVIFYCERVANRVLVKGVKLPEDVMFHLFCPCDQPLTLHPISVQTKLQTVVNRSRKKIFLKDEYFSIYYKNSTFEFKARKLIPEFNPVPLNIDRKVESLKKAEPSFDKFKLNKLVFLQYEIDPLKFLEEFDSCFTKDFPDEEKSIYLFKHIPVVDKQKFRNVWSLPLAEQYEKLKSLFLDEYLVSYIKHKSSKLSTEYSAYSSVRKFIEDKLEIYKKYESLNDKEALNKVIYELPSEISANFLRKGAATSKEKLINLATLIDLRIKTEYDQLIQTNSSALSRNSSNHLQNLSISTDESTSTQASSLYTAVTIFNDDNNSISISSESRQSNENQRLSKKRTFKSPSVLADASQTIAKRPRGRPRKIVANKDNPLSK